MSKSLYLYIINIIKNVYFWISIFFFFYGLFDIFIEPSLPPDYQKLPEIWPYLSFLIFVIMFFIAGAVAYHKLRSTHLDDFYKFSPEANGDRIFRIFYRLYQDGKFNKDSSTERRQKWDEDLIKRLKEFCKNNFYHNYLSKTGRRNYKFSPLKDSEYNNALQELEHLLNRDFNSFVITTALNSQTG